MMVPKRLQDLPDGNAAVSKVQPESVTFHIPTNSKYQVSTADAIQASTKSRNLIGQHVCCLNYRLNRMENKVWRKGEMLTNSD